MTIDAVYFPWCRHGLGEKKCLDQVKTGLEMPNMGASWIKERNLKVGETMSH